MIGPYIIPMEWKSWVHVPEGSDFPIQNLPFGIIRHPKKGKRVAVPIGHLILDLAELFEMGKLEIPGLTQRHLQAETLNELISLGKSTTRALRKRISELLKEDNHELKGHPEGLENFLYGAHSVEMCMPVRVPNYTDFYSSLEHATNVGIMFRGKENALMPNWKHMPIGYHGRPSSIVVHGTPVRRPMGQTMPDGVESPVFGPTKQLDFELEVGFVVGRETLLGSRVSTQEAEEYIFGLVLFNDWSARDIQKWEYQPLGPFLAKNFASTISPWVVTLDALEPFRVSGPEQDPSPLSYLQYSGNKNFDLNLEVAIQPEGGAETIVSRSNFKYMYWNMAQQLAHHTINGCNICVGDIYASGTISGPDPGSYGSMLELTWRGTQPIQMNGGGERKFIQDGDWVAVRGWCQKGPFRIGFGEAGGKVLPAQ